MTQHSPLPYKQPNKQAMCVRKDQTQQGSMSELLFVRLLEVLKSTISPTPLTTTTVAIKHTRTFWKIMLQ